MPTQRSPARPRRLRLPTTVLSRMLQRRRGAWLESPRLFAGGPTHVQRGRFAIVGDLQRTSSLEFWRPSNAREGEQLIHQIVAARPDFLAIVGDLVFWGSSAGAWAAFDHRA